MTTLTPLQRHYIHAYSKEGYTELNDLFSSHGIPTEEQYINYINNDKK